MSLSIGSCPDSLPCGPCHASTYFIKASKEENQQSLLAKQKQDRSSRITKVASHHFCHIPQVRSKSQVLPTLKGGDLQGMPTQRMGSFGAMVEVVYHKQGRITHAGFQLYSPHPTFSWLYFSPPPKPFPFLSLFTYVLSHLAFL